MTEVRFATKQALFHSQNRMSFGESATGFRNQTAAGTEKGTA